MARSFGYPLPVILLLSLAFFTIVSSKSEQRQQQTGYSQAAAVSEPAVQQPNLTTASSLIASGSEEVDSSEEDDGEDDEDEGEAEEGEDEEGDDIEDEEEEEREEDEASLPDSDDEYEDELRAVAAAKKPAAQVSRSTADDGSSKPHAAAESTDKEVTELLEYERRKKTVAAGSGKVSKDKRVPTVKKELSTQKEILVADNGTQVQPNNPLHIEMLDRAVELPKEHMKNELQETESYEKAEQQPQLLNYESAYTVLRPAETLKKLSKRQGALLEDLKAYLLDVANREKLQEIRTEEGLLAESLLKLFATLAENPQRCNRVHRLLNTIKADLDYSRLAADAQKRLVQMTNPIIREATLTATVPSSSIDRVTKKPKKKKKKKKKLRHHRLSATTSTTTEVTTGPQPSPAQALATTETPWSSTTTSTAAAKWKLVAERLFGPPWSQEDDESNVAKVRYSVSSKPRTLSLIQRQLEDKERDSLKALNSERKALMLKAAREYSQPRLLHFGKINTHQQTSSAEDLTDAYQSSERAYNRAHFGQLVSPSSSRLGGYVHPRERPVIPYPEQQQPPPPPPPPQHPPSSHFDVNFARNQEYLPTGRDFAASKPWQIDRGWQSTWNWRQQQPEPQPVKPWLPWHTERDYFARLEEEEEETAKAWEQAQQRQQQNWNRPNLRDNFPPWLEEKEVQRVLQTPDSWSKAEKSRDYATQREENIARWESSRNNNSVLKSSDQSKQEDDSKEAPKLTMKTWNSLTSDPATWPFKLPGAKPWPKDENGKSYNPNAELVRKLGLYKNGRLRPDKETLKDLKQQKLQKNEKVQQGEIVQAENPRPITWSGKISPKVNSWIEPDEQQSAWFNKWKQFAYHKVTAQPTSALNNGDKPNSGKNAFIAVSAVSAPRYGNDWRKNDIEEIGQVNGPGSASDDPDHPSSQMRMNLWKKSSRTNATGNIDKVPKIDTLENQLEDLKEKEGPVLLEVNVSIKNSTFHETSMLSTSTPAVITKKSGFADNKSKQNVTLQKN